MRRRLDDELLAISPPPEFQDRPALPPPVFRDTSPSSLEINPPPDFGNNSTNSHAPQCKRYSVQQNICEFADKIAFNILNEAMIIAALVPESTESTEFQSVDSTPSCPFSSDSSDNDSLSTTTSWEYLSRSNSISDLHCQPCSTTLQPFLQKGDRKHNFSKSINCLRKSTSEGQGMTRHVGTTTSSVVPPPKDICKQSRKVNQSDSQPSEKETVKIGSINESSNEDDVCYTVPYQCDIYSLPIDNISSASQNESPVLAKRSNRKGHREKLKRMPRSFPLSSDMQFSVSEEQQSSSIASRNLQAREDKSSHENCNKEKSGSIKLASIHRQRSSLQEVNVNTNRESTLCQRERNNNAEKERFTQEANQWNKKRRSKSVEIDHHNSINFRKSSHQTEQTVGEAHDCHNNEDGKEKRNFGRTLLNLFRRSRPKSKQSTPVNEILCCNSDNREGQNISRALPSPPSTPEIGREVSCSSPIEARDFAASIEKVKDCGWYWGPLSSEAAEDLLRGEPDGSFIVRDSSDAHYIFSLTFKLNGLVRHVRIEHDQGNFSFGPLTRFKSATIVDFVEKAVAHSRSGRYLFFLHRRPVLGPMRVQLLHPYSRFRHPRSLQHMCRFVILKYVRRDLLDTLPLPKPLIEYLNTTHYYFEHQELSHS